MTAWVAGALAVALGATQAAAVYYPGPVLSEFMGKLLAAVGR